MTPLDAAQLSSPPINAAGACTYFHAKTRAAGQALGLGGFAFYFLGRGGVLGDVSAQEVAEAFGWMHPDMVAKVWNAACEITRPSMATEAFLATSAEIAREQLADVAGLDAFADAAQQAIDGVDRSGLALFSGMAAQPVPVDSPARAFHLVLVLRELRGSVHINAVAQNGVAPGVAHAIRRPDDVAAFGWGEGPPTTDRDRRALEQADRDTDAMMEPMYAVLDAGALDALVAGAHAINGAFDDSARFINRAKS